MKSIKLFLVTFTLSLLSFSSVVNAFEADEWYDSNHFWYDTSNKRSPTPTGFCQLFSLGVSDVYPHTQYGSTTWRVTCDGPYGRGYRGDCPHSDPASGCGQSPDIPDNCPEAGSIQRITTIINGKKVNGSFVEDDPDALDDRHFSGKYYDASNCLYMPSYGGSTIKKGTGDCGPFQDGSVRCSQDIFSVGQVDDPSVIPANNPPTFLQDDTQLSEDDRSTDTRQNAIQETTLDPVVETLPDGTIQKTETTITTETRGDGIVVSEQTDVTTIVDSEGITKQQTVTTTTTTNPDGSQTVVEDTHYSFTQHPQTVFTVTDDGDNVTNSLIIGQTVEGNTKQTTVRDADGNIVSQSTEENNAEQKKAEQEGEKDQVCKDNPDSEECADDVKPVEFETTEKGKFPGDEEAGSAFAKFNAAKEELSTTVTDIKAEIENKLSVSLSQGGTSVDSDPLLYRGDQVSSGGPVANLIKWFDFMSIGTLVLLAAAFYAFWTLLER